MIAPASCAPLGINVVTTRPHTHSPQSVHVTICCARRLHLPEVGRATSWAGCAAHKKQSDGRRPMCDDQRPACPTHYTPRRRARWTCTRGQPKTGGHTTRETCHILLAAPEQGRTELPNYRTKPLANELTNYRTKPSLPNYRTTELPNYRTKPSLPTYRLTRLPNYRTTELPNYRTTDLQNYRYRPTA